MKNVYEMFPGGKALAAYLLLSELPAGVDPLGPDNMLVLANGLLTGAPFSTATRFTAAAKSPLTGGYGESEAGGFWGPELKMAGYEAVVLTGRAADARLPVDQGRPGRNPARRSPVEARAGGGAGDDPRRAGRQARPGAADRAGRRKPGAVRSAHERPAPFQRAHGHGRGHGVEEPQGDRGARQQQVSRQCRRAGRAIADLGKRLAKQVKENPLSWDLQVKGTPGLTAGLNAGGILPTRNFHEGAFEGVDNLRWEAYEKEILSARRSCYACAVRCKREVKVGGKAGDRYQVSDSYGGPEYEAVAGLRLELRHRRPAGRGEGERAVRPLHDGRDLDAARSSRSRWNASSTG